MKKIFLLMLVVFYINVDAQEIELIGLRLYQEIKQNNKQQRMEIGLFLTDTVQLVSLSPKSNITILKDDTEKDLKIPAYKNKLIDFNRSQLFNKGIEILIESKVIPSKTANNIHIKGQFYYNIIDNQHSESIIIKNLNFNNLDTLSFSEKNYKLKKSYYNDSKKGAMAAFSFENNNSLTYISAIVEVDVTGKTVDTKIFKRYTNTATFAFPKTELINNKHLKITYKKIKNKSVTIDQKFGLGL